MQGEFEERWEVEEGRPEFGGDVGGDMEFLEMGRTVQNVAEASVHWESAVFDVGGRRVKQSKGGETR